MAKMMSEYIILREIKAGNISWDDTVTVSRTADATGGSGALLAEGETYTVRQLFENMSIFSGNDATVALAEHIAGSEERFARMMNDAAREIGLSDGPPVSGNFGVQQHDGGLSETERRTVQDDQLELDAGRLDRNRHRF
jgi:D-alanyl-D-alanine carboxypeptidase (penicillin-binding protein 5/6)